MPQRKALKQIYEHSVPIPAEETLINQDDMAALIQAYRQHDENREMVIKKCRDIQKAAKQAIYSLHRADFDAAQQLLDKSTRLIRELLPVIEANSDLRDGSFSFSLEETTEGLLFQHFLMEGKILPWKSIDLPISKDEYIGGLLDFTGELNRFSISRATRHDAESVEHCRTIVELVMGRMLEIDFRNGNLRKKYDTLKYVLKNIENQVYELSLYGNLRPVGEAQQDGAGDQKQAAQLS